MGKDFDDDIEEVELDAITIPDEDGNDREYAIIASFFLGDTDYVALCPILEDGLLEEDTVLFYRCEGDDENLDLEEIDSDEEMNQVIAAYEDLCSEDEEE